MIDLEKLKQAALAAKTNGIKSNLDWLSFAKLCTPSAILELIERLEAAEKQLGSLTEELNNRCTEGYQLREKLEAAETSATQWEESYHSEQQDRLETVIALREKLEASEKDATRLDYLSSEMNRTVHYLTGKWYWSRKPYKTYMRKESIREAIDAAMKEQDK